MRWSKTLFPYLIIIALGFILVACGDNEGSSSNEKVDDNELIGNTTENDEESVTVNIGDLGIVSGAGTYIALEKGYFAEEGIEIEMSTFDTGSDMISLLGSGDLDVGPGTISAGLFNAVGRDIPLKLVADHGNASPGHGSSAMVVRKDLIEEGDFKDPSDLKGKKIAISGQGTSANIAIDRLLEEGGLTLDDVEIVVMAFPEMLAAFENKAIDLAGFIEPLTTVANNKGLIERWRGYDEIYPDLQVAGVMYSPQFAEEKEEIAKKYLKAYIKGVRDYVDAFEKDINKDEIIEILIKYTSVDEPEIFDTMVVSGINPDGYLNKQGLIDDLNWYDENGFLDNKPEIDELYDEKFIDYVLEELGEYE